MAETPVSVRFVYDDVLDEVVMLVDADPPAPPEGYEQVWSPVSGSTWVVASFKPKDKNLTAVPVATYVVIPTDGTAPQRWQVEYRSGAWQMPGTRLW